MGKQQKDEYRYRDSVDGQFIKKKEAEQRPRETEKERVKPRPPTPPKKKT